MLLFVHIFFVQSLLSVSCFHSRSVWETIYRSHTRNFDNEEAFLLSHSSYSDIIKRADYIHKEKFHAYIIEIRENCDGSCHDDLRKVVANNRYNVVNAEYGQLIATPLEMEELASNIAGYFKRFTPMPPQLKIENDLGELASKCAITPTKASIALHVAVCGMSSSMLPNFIDSLSALSSSAKLKLNSDTSGLEADSPGMMTVSTRCEHLPTVLQLLPELPEVMWVEERLPVVPHNRWAKGICQSGIPSSTPLYDANITGYRQVIGIADTGIDVRSGYFHDPLVPIPYNKTNFLHRKIVSYLTQYGDDTDAYLPNSLAADGHGTHVCGSAAGFSYRDYGDYKEYNGAAYNSKIAFMDIQKQTYKNISSTLTPPPDLYKSFFKVFYNNATARVFSNSWGSKTGKGNEYTSEARSVDRFMWDFPEALVIFAAGNEGDKGSRTVGSPSTNKNGICAGASLNDHESFLAYSISGTAFDSDKIANFSSKGPTADGRLKPDILAPGWWVTSAIAGGPSAGTPQYGVQGLQGTSQAAPLLAGQAALVRDYFMSGFYPSGVKTPKDGFVPSGALLKAILLHSGKKLNAVIDSKGVIRKADVYPSTVQGYGLVQVESVLNFGVSRTSPLSLFVIGAVDPYIVTNIGNSTKKTSSNPLYASLDKTGTSDKYYVKTSSSTTTIRVTLTYTDAVSAPGAKQILVNNLDVTLTETLSGVAFLPLPNGNSKVNNVEQIILRSPKPNTNYTITVTANYTTRPQPYALVVTGDVTRYNGTSAMEATIILDDATKISSVNQGVISVLAIVCLMLLLVVICVACFNKRPKGAADNYQMAINDGQPSS